MKMDIEFAEFDAMDGFMESFDGKDLPVGQFMVEIHLFNSLAAKSYLDWYVEQLHP